MPDSVEMPAPVNTTARRDSAISAARRSRPDVVSEDMLNHKPRRTEEGKMAGGYPGSAKPVIDAQQLSPASTAADRQIVS
jgi:hypothetical protein